MGIYFLFKFMVNEQVLISHHLQGSNTYTNTSLFFSFLIFDVSLLFTVQVARVKLLG